MFTLQPIAQLVDVYLALLAEQAGGRSLLDAPREKIPGGGTEVTGVRDYAAGDEYRYVDWTWCGRRDELLTKVFEGNADLHYYIMLDCSSSMKEGCPEKFHLARQIAAVLGYMATSKLDHFSVLGFAGGIITESDPIRHLARFPRLLQFLEELVPQGMHTNLTQMAEAFVRRYQRHGPIVIISDFYDRRGFKTAFNMLRDRGYELRLVQINEQREVDPELLGDMELLDVEGGQPRRVTVTERSIKRYIQLYKQFHKSVRDYCKRYSVDYMQIRNDTPEDDVLYRVLGINRIAQSGTQL